jgi:uncharacterized protein YneF (UPF0154 family)
MSTVTGSTETTKKRRLRVLDIAIAVVVVLIVGFLVHTLLTQLSLKHEVSGATAVTDQMITDIQKQNGTNAHTLGDSSFQKQNPASLLTAQFKAVNSHVHGSAVRDHTTVTNDKTGQAVSVIYKYADKPTFYIRVIVTKPKGASAWHVVNLNGNTKETALLSNKY